MKTDLYTKVVLTAIAIFLGILVFQNVTFVTPAQAATAPIPEPTAVQSSGVVDVNIVQINGTSIGTINYSDKGTLPVTIWTNTDK